MNPTDQSWVIYQMTIHKVPEGLKAVCEQAEWDAMELARPGYHKLLHAGISSEAEAERLVRGEPVNPKPRWSKPR